MEKTKANQTTAEEGRTNSPRRGDDLACTCIEIIPAYCLLKLCSVIILSTTRDNPFLSPKDEKVLETMADAP